MATLQSLIILALRPGGRGALQPADDGQAGRLLFLMAFMISALGLLLAARVKQVQSAMPLVQLTITPLMFLSGSLFPLSNLPGWLDVATILNPMTYAVEPIRSAVFDHLDRSRRSGPPSTPASLGIVAGPGAAPGGDRGRHLAWPARPGRGPLRPHRVTPASPSRPLPDPPKQRRTDDGTGSDGERPRHGRRGASVHRLLHEHLGFELLTSAAPAFADVARGTCGCCSAARPAPPDEPCPTAPAGPGGWNRIHFIVDDLAAEVARLRDAGLVFRNDIVTGPGGSQILLQDPSGN